MTRFAFAAAKLAALIAGHASDNLTSGRLLARLGFVPTGEALIFSRPRGVEIAQRRLKLDAGQWRRHGVSQHG